jgi:hypothetical protein
MKKILSWIMLFILMATPSFATTYYACIAGNIDAANAWEDAVGCDGTTFTIGTDGFPASGSVLEANNQAMTINTDPGPNGAVTLQNTAGGTFTISALGTPATVTANGTAVAADLIVTSGSVNATTTLTGTYASSAGTSSANVIQTGHTVGTLAINNSTITAGGAAGTYGVNQSNAGPVSITGTTTINGSATMGVAGYYTTYAGLSVASTVTINGGGVASAYGLSYGGSSNITIPCVVNGGTAVGTEGVYIVGTGIGTFTNNLIGSSTSNPIRGRVIWAPATAKNYYKFDGGGTAIFLSAGLGSDADGTQVTGADTAAQVADNYYFIRKDTGDYTEGTKTTGSGASAYAY